MDPGDCAKWCPFRPGAEELERIRKDVAEVRTIQQTILGKHEQVHFPDRVAHQYQIAGSKVRLRIAEALPAPLQGVGLFHPGAEHIETNPDFFGIMAAFESREDRRVDFLGLTIPRLQQTITRIFSMSSMPPENPRVLGLHSLGIWGLTTLQT